MDNSMLFLGIAAILFVALIFISLRGVKTKKFRITTADGAVLDVTRKFGDNWNDPKDFKAYHQGEKNIWLANHWILKIEEMK